MLDYGNWNNQVQADQLAGDLGILRQNREQVDAVL